MIRNIFYTNVAETNISLSSEIAGKGNTDIPLCAVKQQGKVLYGKIHSHINRGGGSVGKVVSFKSGEVSVRIPGTENLRGYGQYKTYHLEGDIMDVENALEVYKKKLKDDMNLSDLGVMDTLTGYSNRGNKIKSVTLLMDVPGGKPKKLSVQVGQLSFFLKNPDEKVSTFYQDNTKTYEDIKDIFGTPLTEGALISGSSGDRLIMGKVVKITPSGMLDIESFITGKVTRISYTMNNIMIQDEETSNRMLFYKLRTSR